MVYILICVALIMSVIQNYSGKKCSIYVNKASDAVAINVIRSVLCTAIAGIAVLVTKADMTLNPQILLISLLAGVSLSICMLCSVLALKEGAVVLVTVFGTAGLLVPCIAGRFMFFETFTWFQFLGILILIGAMILLVGYNTSLKGKTTPKLLILAFLSMISNGFTMLSQKMYTSYAPGGSVYVFSFLTFGLTSLILLLLFKPLAGSDVKSIPLKQTWKHIIMLAISIFAINQLMTVASASIPSVLLFPLFNGTGLVLSTLMSAMFFKEHLTKQSVIGLILSIVGLVIINSVS